MIGLENILKISLQEVLKTSWRSLEDAFARILKAAWKRLRDVFETYSQDEYIGLDQDVWRDLLKTYDYAKYIYLDQDVLKTSSEDKDLLTRMFDGSNQDEV